MQNKITLLGPIPYDHITTLNNQQIDRYGCLTYPTIALSRLLGRKSRITPVAHVRKRDRQTIKTILKGLPGVELLHINSDMDQGDVMVLKYIEKDRCLEKQYGFMNPIMPDDVKHLLDSDYFLCMPVTDYEISIDTLHFIKNNSESSVIFNAHGVTMAMTSLGDRVNKFWVDRDLYLPYIDILVLSHEQVKYSWFAKEFSLKQLENSDDLTEEEQLEFVTHCFNYGVKAIYITLGDEGSLVYFSENGEVKSEFIESIALPTNPEDTTGKNESFIAGLTFGLIRTKNDYVKAARYGNVIATQRTRGISYNVFDSLEKTSYIVREAYGED
ncbi:MAG: carbohydrate kinase family protein [Gammaproteobacteria bacterium]|nr:carbohydrate kinase family protein [Gammaproteobacteria bacterium]